MIQSRRFHFVASSPGWSGVYAMPARLSPVSDLCRLHHTQRLEGFMADGLKSQILNLKMISLLVLLSLLLLVLLSLASAYNNGGVVEIHALKDIEIDNIIVSLVQHIEAVGILLSAKMHRRSTYTTTLPNNPTPRNTSIQTSSSFLCDLPP